MDTSKRFFQLHGGNRAERPVMRTELGRTAMIGFFERLTSTGVAIEPCGVGAPLGTLARRHGHRVRLIALQLAKASIKRAKNDATDAEALCEAMSRPIMRFVPVKMADQQAAFMLGPVENQPSS